MRVRWVLAVAAAVLGAGALVAGDATPRTAPADVARLASDVESERDHVSALQLAEWIKAQKPGLRVIDVRSQADYDEYHIPTAERVALSALSSLRVRPSDTVVLYSDGGAHAAQGWVFLQLAGVHSAYFLRGGLLDWLEDVMNPTLPADASDSAKAEYARATELSKYFGGEPHRDALPSSVVPMPSGPVVGRDRSKDLIAKRKKRGC